MTTETITETITLDTPIKRGEQTIDTVTLRKPAAGELRGTSLHALAMMEVEALSKIIPRISSPTLTAHEVAALDPADLMQMAGAVAGFLTPKAVLAQAASQSA
jgi:hypothetical protein